MFQQVLKKWCVTILNCNQHSNVRNFSHVPNKLITRLESKQRPMINFPQVCNIHLVIMIASDGHAQSCACFTQSWLLPVFCTDYLFHRSSLKMTIYTPSLLRQPCFYRITWMLRGGGPPLFIGWLRHFYLHLTGNMKLTTMFPPTYLIKCYRYSWTPGSS